MAPFIPILSVSVLKPTDSQGKCKTSYWSFTMKFRVVYVFDALTPNMHSNFAKQLQRKRYWALKAKNSEIGPFFKR